jgi:hypothetical protein
MSRPANSTPFVILIGQFIVRFGVLRGSPVTIAVLWNALPCGWVLRSDVMKKQQPGMLVLPFQSARRHVSKESNKKGNVRINVSLRRVRVTIFAAQNNKCYIFYVVCVCVCVCVSAALGIQHACPAVPSFPLYLINITLFGKSY